MGLVVRIAALGLTVPFGTVRTLVFSVGVGVFFSVGGLGAGSGEQQNRAGGYLPKKAKSQFHAAKVGSLKHCGKLGSSKLPSSY